MSQADVIKEYLVGLGFDVDDESFARFKNGIIGAGLVVTALGGLVIGLTRTIQNSVAEQAKELSSLEDFAALVKEDADSIEKFEYAATTLGSSSAAARSSIRGLSEMIGAAADGFKRAQKVFATLHLDFRKQNGETKTAIELFGELHERIKDLDRREQLAFLSKLGIDPTLLQTILLDWSELSAELDQVNKAIGVSKEDAVGLGKAYQVASDRLSKIISAVYQGVALRLMPRLTKSLNDIRVMILEHLPEILDRITPVLNFVLDVASAGVDMVLEFIRDAGEAVGYIRQLDDATGGWAHVILLAYLAWKAWNSEFAKSPTGEILKLAAAFALLWDDYQGFLNGKKSAINWDSWFGKSIFFLGKFYLGWRAVKLVIGEVAGFLWETFKDIAEIVVIGFAVDRVLEWLAELTGLVRLFNALGFAWLAKDILSLWRPILVVAAAFAFLAYEMGLFGDWSASLAGWRALFWWLEAKFEEFSGMVAEVLSWIGGKFEDAGGVIKAWAKSGAQAVIDAWEGVKAWFSGWFDWLRDRMPSIPHLPSFFGGSTEFALAPSGASAALMRGGSGQQTIHSQTDIHVSGAGDPAAVGRNVAREQRGVTSDMTRNLATVIQ